MGYRRLTGMAVLLVFLAFPASASTVSFLVVETGLNDGISSPQHSSLWEGALMSVFFDAGHIVTNNPILRMEQEAPVEIRGTAMETDFNDAVLAGAEYIIFGFLEYRIQGNRAVPVKIDIKLYETASRELVYQQNFPAGSGRNPNEEYQLAQNAGRSIISHIKDR